jgi:DNA-binding transcriptional regulator PaaX
MNMKSVREKIGKEELALLEDVRLGDLFLGFLTSAGSTYLMHKGARRFAYDRMKKEQQQQIIKRLQRLEKKNLITFEQTDKDKQIIRLTNKGQAQLGKQDVVQQYRTYQNEQYQWDGIWRIVMFDIPQENKTHRHELRRLLQACGFRQVQKSVYVAPYPCKPLRDYISRNRNIGSYIHLIKGEYVGDDERLRKEFCLEA